MIERMFPREYIDGYTAALLDAKRILGDPELKYDLKYCGLSYNVKNLIKILDVLIDSRGILRENPDACLSCNPTTGEFSIYIPKE